MELFSLFLSILLETKYSDVLSYAVQIKRKKNEQHNVQR